MSSNNFLQNFSSVSSNKMVYDFSYKGRYFRFALSKFYSLDIPIWKVSLYETTHNYLVFNIVKSWGFENLFKLDTFFSKSELKKIKKEICK